MKKITVTIGIPAYNEEANIANLLNHLITQSENKNILMKQIIVYSDGSSDSTVYEALKIKSKKIRVIANKERAGKNNAINNIFKLANTDLLILMDADTKPANNNFILSISKMFLLNPRLTLACAKVMPLTPKNWFENTIAYSQIIKIPLYEKIILKNPVYLFNGRTIAYSKLLYKKMKLPKNIIADDAFSYLYAKKNEMEFAYVPDATVLYKAPSNFHDHIKQSTRFYSGQTELKKIFGDQMINNEYSIPKFLLIESAIKGFIQKPIMVMSYLLILAYSKFLVLSNISQSSYLWNMSNSSKKVEGII